MHFFIFMTELLVSREACSLFEDTPWLITLLQPKLTPDSLTLSLTAF